MHFLAILFCLKAHQCSDTECLHPATCCVRLSTDLQDITTQNFVLTNCRLFLTSRRCVWSSVVPHASHCEGSVWDGWWNPKTSDPSNSETCPLRYTGTLDCVQTTVPASLSLRVCCCCFGVTRRLMEPTGSISCSRTKEQLLFWSLYWETIQHFDLNLKYSVAIWRKR
jgi:hypothetical protein